jgi:4-methylaminobutanoate oxidase (formaldehyde-forming)
MKDTADVVIIGGGIIGCAVAYSLSRFSPGRVVLLERRNLVEANSARAAGILMRAREKRVLIPFIQETYRAIADLEDEREESIGLRRVGILSVAASRVEQKSLESLVEISRSAGVRTEWLKREEATKQVPWLSMDDRCVAAFMPEDGFINPCVLAHAYAAAARSRRVEIRQNTEVKEIVCGGDKVEGVMTAKGFISCPVVIDAAGVWAGILAWQLGCGLPMAPVRSHYWMTAADPLFPLDHPIVILPEPKAYTRPECGGLLLGLRETQSFTTDPRRIPEDIAGMPIGREEDEWESLIEGRESLLPFFPSLDRLGIAHYITGFSTYTPDGMFVLGAFQSMNGFFAATGDCGAGIAASGGFGLSTAELALGMRGSFDLEPFRIDRFGSIDPMSEEFRAWCGRARSKKKSG